MTDLATQLITIAILSLQRQLHYNRGLRLDDNSAWWKSHYDFVVVGGGSAGCTLAARLSEHANTSVLLLEAGGPVTITSDIVPLYFYFNSVWNYRTVPQRYSAEGFTQRRVAYPRGRILGGSSSVNYGVYIRGNKRDFDSWSLEYGAPGWTFAEVLPYFLKAENNTDPDVVRAHPDFHSTSGPLQVSTVPNPDPILLLWNEAASRMGWPVRDLNGPHQFGTTILQSTQSPANWTRQNAYSAYVQPIISIRPNLHVLPNSLVTKILFDIKNVSTPTAVGVQFINGNQTYQVYARKEVIVSGGSVNSPQLLMLSGIGPRIQLNQFGIPVVRDLPVGESLSDHILIPLDFLVTNASEIGWSGRKYLAINVETLYQFFAYNYGPLTRYPGLEMFVATGINGDREWPDGMIYLLINQKYVRLEDVLVYHDQSQKEEWSRYLSGLIGNERHLQVAFSNFRPLSKGSIRLASSNPLDHPLIDPNYFSNAQDLAALIQAMSIGLRIAESDFMKSRMVPYWLSVPGCELCPDRPLSRCYAYLTCVARTYTETTSHPVGTCRMGNSSSAQAVVDERLKVLGVRQLRVIDASVMPTVPNANTNAATIMVAEKGADMVRHDHGLI